MRLDLLAALSGAMIALQARANGELSHRLDRVNAGICEPGDVWYWNEFRGSFLLEVIR